MLLLLALPLVAQEDRRVADLLKKANEEYEAGKATWDKFVFAADDVTDQELADLCAHYDKAIELAQKVSESGDSGEADTIVLRLARRTAKLRATACAREMRKAAEAAKLKKAAEPQAPEPVPEQKPAPPPEPEPAREPEPQAEAAPAPAAGEPDVLPLPEISETKEQRSRGIQSARDFLMNTYFANRKRDALIDVCVHCKGRGFVYLPYRDPKTQKPAKQECGGCGATGYLFNEPVARKGFWLCWSPLFRRDEGERARFQQDMATWKQDPKRIPEFLKSVSIKEVDYHGLWAVVEWEERGATGDGEKFTRGVKRKLFRAGRQWFFYDHDRDKEMFSEKPDGD
ncbi:MAG TPA: hypothetical protein VFX78_07020 [Candidatus Eisenbacteria bacterium]|nr:hypothetical protein [Candidatus Eisenbacteria bacterium]